MASRSRSSMSFATVGSSTSWSSECSHFVISEVYRCRSGSKYSLLSTRWSVGSDLTTQLSWSGTIVAGISSGMHAIIELADAKRCSPSHDSATYVITANPTHIAHATPGRNRNAKYIASTTE